MGSQSSILITDNSVEVSHRNGKITPSPGDQVGGAGDQKTSCKT